MSSISKIVDLISDLLEASHDHKDTYYHITKSLVNSLELKACSYYSLSPYCSLLTLKAQYGLSYDLYDSFMADNSCTAGSVLESNEILYIDDVSKQTKYRNKKLICEYNLNAALMVPISFPSSHEYNFHFGTCGVLCVYPKKDQEIQHLLNVLKEIQKLLGRIICFSVESHKLKIRKQIVDQAIVSTDLNSYLHRVLKILKDMWNFEAGSIFLENERSKLLRLHATTGMQDKSKRKNEIFYKPDEELNIIKSFKKKDEIFIYYENRDTSFRRYPEQIEGKMITRGWIPIKSPIVKHLYEKRTIGIIRFVNKIYDFNGIDERGVFSWEDIVILRYVSDVIGVNSFLMRTSESRSIGLERTLHGVKTFVSSALRSLLHLEERGEISKYANDNRFKYHILDSIANLEAIKWQIDRFVEFERQASISLTKVRLFGDVLSKVVGVAKKSKRTFNLESLDITGLKTYEFNNIPEVKGDQEALIIVFRNLIENAMKYCPENKKCKIDLSYRKEPEKVIITITDYGIGIPSEDRSWIFTEGFRSDNAMRRIPSGNGLGLTHSKSLIHEMGGDLRLLDSIENTTFEVELEKYKD